MALIPDRYDEALAAYLTSYERLLPTCPEMFDGARELLFELLNSGIRLALVTGKGPGSTDLTLAHFRLKSFFSEIATGSPQGSVKALRIREIAERWGVTPAEVLYVGDAPSDVTAAREAGVQIIAAAWCSEAHSAGLQSINPDAVLHSINELKMWLQRNGSAPALRLP